MEQQSALRSPGAQNRLIHRAGAKPHAHHVATNRRLDCRPFGNKVIQLAEENELPAPDFHVTDNRTVVTLFARREFDDLSQSERVRACYQHCALKRARREKMTNQTLRERFHLRPKDGPRVSQVIAAAVEERLIKPDPAFGTSRKYACYLPFWA